MLPTKLVEVAQPMTEQFFINVLYTIQSVTSDEVKIVAEQNEKLNFHWVMIFACVAILFIGYKFLVTKFNGIEKESSAVKNILLALLIIGSVITFCITTFNITLLVGVVAVLAIYGLSFFLTGRYIVYVAKITTFLIIIMSALITIFVTYKTYSAREFLSINVEAHLQNIEGKNFTLDENFYSLNAKRYKTISNEKNLQPIYYPDWTILSLKDLLTEEENTLKEIKLIKQKIYQDNEMVISKLANQNYSANAVEKLFSKEAIEFCAQEKLININKLEKPSAYSSDFYQCYIEKFKKVKERTIQNRK